MRKRLKILLKPLGKKQFMCLTQEYYMLNYCNYKDVSEFLNYVKSLKKQINGTKVKIISNKQTLFCLTIALWNKVYYQSLIQIKGMTKDITAEKVQEILLDEKQRLNVDFEHQH